MKNTLYFLLLATMFSLSNAFATEQLEEELNQMNKFSSFLNEIENFEKELNQRVDINESPNFLNESDIIKKKLEQDIPSSSQELEFPENNTVELNNLNINQIQEIEDRKVDDEEKQHTITKLPDLSEAVSESAKIDIDKDLPEHVDNLLEESENKVTKSQQDTLNTEAAKNLEAESPPLSTSSNESTTDLRKNSQADQEIDLEENKLLESSISQSLEKKENAPEVENQIEEKKVEKAKDNPKDLNKENREKPITKRDKKDELKEDKDSQKLTNVQKRNYKRAQSKSIYKRQYNSLNEHLPTTIFIGDYSKQLFYCIKKNNLSCLKGIMSKLEEIGLATQEILRFRNKFGDTPLIYAVKKSEIDTVRFLLLQGADLRVVDYKHQSPISIAIERKEIDIINAIAEMTLQLLEERKLSNKESSEMYNWARETKENNEFQCNEIQAK